MLWHRTNGAGSYSRMGNTTETHLCGKKKKWNEVSNNMESKQKRTALVTGGSSGIGRCTAVALSKAGYIVYEFSRRRLLVHILRGLHRKITAHQFVWRV